MRNTLIGFLLLLTVACNKADLSLPEGIRKLVQDKDCSCQPYIDLYRWQGQQVFLLKMKGPACSWVPAYYHTDGSTLALPSGYNATKFEQEAVSLSTVWNCGQ